MLFRSAAYPATSQPPKYPAAKGAPVPFPRLTAPKYYWCADSASYFAEPKAGRFALSFSYNSQTSGAPRPDGLKSVPNEGLFASAQDCRRPVSPPPFLPEYTHHAPAQYAEAPLWSVRKKNLPAGSMLQRILSYVSMLYNALDLIIGQPPV